VVTVPDMALAVAVVEHQRERAARARPASL
jgi:hypothetical protein